MILIVLAVVVAITLVTIIGVGIFIVMSIDDRDVVSRARQGWIDRRSENDNEGW
ncbi:MAG: hypothetical protein KDJ52_33880 [Anaerolineae bacterium]|nr:hypothetical protein [Anaerolineae bacterium]